MVSIRIQAIKVKILKTVLKGSNYLLNVYSNLYQFTILTSYCKNMGNTNYDLRIVFTIFSVLE